MNVVHVSGPLFTHEADAAIDDFCDELGDQMGRDGVALVRNNLGTVLKHPTGHLQSVIHTVSFGDDDVVTDGDIIYGDWIEGTGERNKTTRFKGYATFRKVTQQLDAKAEAIAARVLPRFLRRMN